MTTPIASSPSSSITSFDPSPKRWYSLALLVGTCLLGSGVFGILGLLRSSHHVTFSKPLDRVFASVDTSGDIILILVGLFGVCLVAYGGNKLLQIREEEKLVELGFQPQKDRSNEFQKIQKGEFQIFNIELNLTSFVLRARSNALFESSQSSKNEIEKLGELLVEMGFIDVREVEKKQLAVLGFGNFFAVEGFYPAGQDPDFSRLRKGEFRAFNAIFEDEPGSKTLHIALRAHFGDLLITHNIALPESERIARLLKSLRYSESAVWV